MARYHLFVPKRVSKEIGKLDFSARKRIVAEILALQNDPFPKGKKIKRIKGRGDEFLRLRAGDYRILYEVVGKEVHVLGVVHRRDLEELIRKQ